MRNLIRLIVVLLCPLFSWNVGASDVPWPGKQPVKIILPFAAGGASDVVARQLAKILGEQTGQTFVVDNKPGASGAIGAVLASQAAPDGYTLLQSIGSYFTITPHFMKLQHDPLEDLTPISDLAHGMLVLIGHPSFPAKDINDIFRIAKQKPGSVSYGSFGLGTVSHLAGEMLNIRGGVKMTHVAYKGSGPGHNDLVSGHIQLMFDTVTSAGPSIKAGRARPFAVNSHVRNPAFPDIPTFTELGFPEMELFAPGSVMFGPKGMSKELVNQINSALTKAMATKEYQDRLKMNGSAPRKTETSEEFRKDLMKDAESLGAFIKTHEIKME